MVAYRRKIILQTVLYDLACLLWIISLVFARLGWIASPLGMFPAPLVLYGLLALTVLFFSLSLSFLQGGESSLRGWLAGAIWLALFAILERQWPGLPADLRIASWILPFQELSLAVLAVGWAGFMAALAIFTAQTYRGASHPYARLRIALWIWPLGLTILGDLMIFAWVTLPGINPFGELPRSMLSLATSPVVLTLLSGPALQSPIGFAWIYLWFGAGLHMAGAFLTAAVVVYRIIPRVRFDMHRLLREYSLSISNVLDTGLLSTVAIGLINEAIEIRFGCLFLVEYENNASGGKLYRLCGFKGVGEKDPPVGIFPVGSPLIDYFIHERVALSQFALERLPRFKSISSDEKSWILAIQADVFVPIHVKEEWIGLLVLGPKVSGAMYSEDELDFLGILADQTAVALHNARLVESLTRLNNDFRRAYSALERANRHLERLDRTKTDFISIASHELRTPLSVIRGYNEILLEEPAVKNNPYYSKMVAGIQTGILRLHEIVESMLDMASIDARAFQLNTEPVSLHILLRMVLEGIKKSDFDRDLAIEIDDLRDLPMVNADPEALRKVFYHLILNAIKFTPDGGRIQITGSSMPSDHDNLPDGGVEIIISDTGIGIALEFQELIFTKYYQTGNLSLHSSGKTKFKGGGQGLGLAIAKGIIEMHGGKIRVESPGYDEEKCPGSKFYVLLPLKG